MTRETKLNAFRDEIENIFEEMNSVIDDIEDSQYELESYASDIMELSNRSIESLVNDSMQYNSIPMMSSEGAKDDLDSRTNDLKEYILKLIEIGKEMKRWKLNVDFKTFVRYQVFEEMPLDYLDNIMTLFDRFVVPALKETKKKKTAKKKK